MRKKFYKGTRKGGFLITNMICRNHRTIKGVGNFRIRYKFSTVLEWGKEKRQLKTVILERLKLENAINYFQSSL